MSLAIIMGLLIPLKAKIPWTMSLPGQDNRGISTNMRHEK
jgi:hypothetical protein